MTKLLVSDDILEIKNYLGKILLDLNLKQEHPDVLYFDADQKLGIEQAKEIKKFLSIKPFNAKGKVVMLEAAQNLTIDAQNALLKILEEPPENAIIILTTPKKDQLIPTVVSRCEIVYINKSDKSEISDASEKSDKSENLKYIESLSSLSIEQRFEIIEKIEDKDQFLKELVSYYRQKLLQEPKYLKINKMMLDAEEWNNQNVNTRAILEYLMLELPQD